MDSQRKIWIMLFMVISPWVSLMAQPNHQKSDLQRLIDWIFNNEEMWYEKEHSNFSSEESLVMRVDLNTDWKFSIGDNPSWANESYNDSNWEMIRVPSPWENEGFNGYNGFGWYRITFDGTELNRNESHTLILGQIDDADETYLNGKMIGKSGKLHPDYKTAYFAHRQYPLKPSYINYDGKNVIAVRVYDDEIDGGIIAGKPGIYGSSYTEYMEQNLSGQWEFRPTDDTRNYPSDNSMWDDIWVPSHWDNQGYRSLDGIAWYRKEFKLAFQPQEGENYYLLLGKIDDFDITFINGQKIGTTNDHKKYWDSRSYNQLRSYLIPDGLLHTDQPNVITIRVEDIGDFGGIYTGPVGIIQEANLTKAIRK